MFLNTNILVILIVCVFISHFARLYLESNWWAPSLYDTCLERAYVSSDVKVTAACIH